MTHPPRTTPLASQPSLALFDLDDTLCDYAAARDLRLRTAFTVGARAVGADVAALDLDALVAASIATHPHGADHFAALLVTAGIAPAAGGVAREWYVANRFHGLALFPDALATLAAVRAALPDRRLGLVTNGPSSVQRAKIELLGVAPWVDFILVSEEVGVWKPEPAIFHAALRAGAATAQEAVMIGDSAENDIVGAHGVGIRSVWISPGGAPWIGPRRAPDHVAPDLAAVRTLLGAD